MGKIIAFWNLKGGTSKTLSSFNISHLLANEGKKVLISGLDYQCNQTEHNLTINKTDQIRDNENEGLYRLVKDLVNEKEVDPLKFVCSINDNLDILPETDFLEDLEEMTLSKEEYRVYTKEVFEFFKTEYDYVVIDCPPRKTSVFREVLKVCDLLIVVLDLSISSESGLRKVLKFIQKSKKISKLTGLEYRILLNRYNSSYKSHKETRKRLTSNVGTKDYVFETTIRQSMEVENSVREYTPVFKYRPDSRGSEDFNHLLDEIMNITEE